LARDDLADATLDRAEVARREVRRFLMFLIVGGIGFVVDTGALTVFAVACSLDRVLAKGLAFSLAVATTFVCNRRWTYPESRDKFMLPQLMQFVLVSCVGLAINLLVFGWADRFALGYTTPIVALYVGQAAAVGVALFWNYAANRLITFRSVGLGT